MLRTPAVVLALVAAMPAGARGNPAGEVTSRGAGDAVRVGVDYELDIDTASIRRERVGDPTADPLAPLPVRRELAYRRARQLVTPRAEAAVAGDLWLSLAAPIVLADAAQLDVADGVDRTTASTFSDGILPATGFDAQSPGAPPGGSVVFRGAARAGISELRAGIGYAVMNQARVATGPTWKLGAELRLAIGRTMWFDAVDPGRETGVSTGVHELRLWTSFDRRLRYVEGWFEADYQLPLVIRDGALYQDPGFGATKVDPAQTASAGFGLETFLVDDAAARRRISVELATRLTAHLEGRGYSELWEVFAFAGDRRTAGPLVLDGDPVTPGLQALGHPGVTNLESFLETSARLALRVQLGGHVSLAALGALRWRTDHAISFAPAGIDLPTCPTGAPRCETDDNDLVNPGSQEVNPLHARRIDLVGHRYIAAEGRGYALGVAASVRF